MKKKLILPLVLSASALLVASCGGNSSSSSSSTQSSSSESEYIPNYDYAQAVEEPADWSNIKGVEGGSTGAISLVDKDINYKTNVLGALEKYAVDHAITGMPLFENGGYVMYQPRIEKGTNDYITGYGFGIMREGNLTGELTGTEKPTYYHGYEANDPQSINYLDDQGSQIGDLYGNAASAYFGVKMSKDKKSYDWYGVLSSKDRPVALDKDGKVIADQDSSTTSTKWRIYVRADDAGVTYRTASKETERAKFNNKKVALKDYLDAFRVLLCGDFAYYRGTELAGKTGYQGIKGAAAYYAASKAGIDSEAAIKAFNEIGIKSGTDADGAYLDFELLAPTTRFYAMYSLGSNLYAPINLDFFKLVTNNFQNPEFYGSFNNDKTASPVDNFLSTGPYFLEDWETDKKIVFGRNADWFEIKNDANVYRIPGIYQTVLAAVNTDPNAAIKEFLLGNLDSAGIPTEYLDRFKSDPRTTQVPGDSVFKLNLNTCTATQWEKLFGKNGTISQTAESNYWNVKPWMSNEDFVRGLFYSINRDEFATKNGSIASINYFSSNYMSDPENGISYNTTEQHAEAIRGFWGDSISTGGFSTNLAQAAFDRAVDKLLADKVVPESKKLTIDIWWMYQQHIKRYGEDIAKYIQDAFNNSAKAKAAGITLEVKNEAVDVWSDVYYKHLMVGQFDLGFGSISGNSLDPLNFMEVLKSDNSSGFTLNWGPDTSALDLNFDGKVWSFDNLWGATDHGVVTYKGQALPPAVITFGKEPEFDEDGNLVFTYSFQTAKQYMAQLDDPDAAIIAALPDDEYEIGFDYFYVTDWAQAQVKLAFDEDGEAVLDDDYEGLISEFAIEAKTDHLEITFGLTPDFLEFFAGGEALGNLYFGVEATQKIKGIESGYKTEGVVAFADSSALSE